MRSAPRRPAFGFARRPSSPDGVVATQGEGVEILIRMLTAVRGAESRQFENPVPQPAGRLGIIGYVNEPPRPSAGAWILARFVGDRSCHIATNLVGARDDAGAACARVLCDHVCDRKPPHAFERQDGAARKGGGGADLIVAHSARGALSGVGHAAYSRIVPSATDSSDAERRASEREETRRVRSPERHTLNPRGIIYTPKPYLMV